MVAAILPTEPGGVLAIGAVTADTAGSRSLQRPGMTGMSSTRSTGIVVSTRPAEQTARVLGTGIKVWQIARTYLEVGRDWDRLRTAYHWLTEAQLRDAMRYAEEHAQAIDDRIQEDYARLPEDLRPDPPLHWP
jgi:uncharacterized protein (DUF433 family)